MNEENLHLPHNLEAEEGVIACCCLDGTSEVYDRISRIIDPDDFYVERNRLLFISISKIAERGDELSEISLYEQTKKLGCLDAVGELSGIMSVMNRVETSSSSNYFAKIVKQKSELRTIARNCRIAAEQALSETIEPDVIRSGVESQMIELAENDQSAKDLGTSVDTLREEYRQMMAREYVSDVVKTHINHLDDKLGNGGLAPGEVMVLAAPTSCGKSQLALNIALRAATEGGVAPAIVSLEMPQKQVTQRLVTCLSGVWIRRIRDGVATQDDIDDVNVALDKIKDLNIKSIHNVKSIQDLASQARSLVRSDNIKLLMIDYLQLIPFSQRGSKNDAIADVSHRIKQLALELNIPIILLCQVGREGAKRPGGLMLYDLKDSGDIENDADIVLLMWPKEGDIEESKKVDSHGPYVEMMYNVAKNREGERDVKGIFKFRHFTGRFY